VVCLFHQQEQQQEQEQQQLGLGGRARCVALHPLNVASVVYCMAWLMGAVLRFPPRLLSSPLATVVGDVV
jgi:hypothetical protein